MIKIKKINIKQFGIIRNFEFELGNRSVTVIFGDNESGKTTILDAILEALFSVKDMNAYFEGINKYISNSNSSLAISLPNSQLPTANCLLDDSRSNLSVELEIDNLQMSFPQKETLDKIISIPSIYARNIFVVREGEINFSHQDNWWSVIKNRLSRLSGDYVKIADNIRDIAGLETDGKWINRPDRPIADYHEKLNAKLSELKTSKEDIKELGRLSKQKAEIDNKLKRCHERLDELKKARKAFLYLEGRKLVNQYNDTQKKSIRLEKFKGNKLNIWRNTETEIIKARQVLELSAKHRDEFASLINKNIKDITDREQSIASWERLENEVIPALETKLVDYRQRETRLQRGSAGKTMTPLWIILCAISSLSITYVSLTINPVFFPVAGIIFVALGYSVKVWWSSRRIGTQLQSLERSIKNVFKRVENEEKDINNISSWLIENRNKNHELKKKINLIKENELPNLEHITKELTSSINALDSKLQKLCNFTNALKINTECSSWEDLQAKCNERETFHAGLNMLSDQINQLLSAKFEEEWEEKLSELKPFETVKTEWNEKLANKLDELVEGMNTELKTLNEKIVELKINIARLGCRMPEDIWEKEDEILAELTRLETDRKAALVAAEIIETVSQEQDRLVNNVISNGNDSATNLFSVITDKRYKRVFLDKNNIYANTIKDHIIPINHLSSGTMAQLYFALRVNLAQSLLMGKTAFLLLDDPFLACDTGRTNKMINILHEITKNGWQLIYFTIDEAIVSMFKDRFKDDLNICNLSAI